MQNGISESTKMGLCQAPGHLFNERICQASPRGAEIYNESPTLLCTITNQTAGLWSQGPVRQGQHITNIDSNTN